MATDFTPRIAKWEDIKPGAVVQFGLPSFPKGHHTVKSLSNDGACIPEGIGYRFFYPIHFSEGHVTLIRPAPAPLTREDVEWLEENATEWLEEAVSAPSASISRTALAETARRNLAEIIAKLKDMTK